MAEASFIKLAGGQLVPANGSDLQVLEKVKNGALVHAEFKQPRNPLFHRKFFALMNLGFEYWEPELPVYKGQVAEKSFEKFRADTTILAGHYDVVVNIQGDVQVVPKSISFAAIDDIEFNDIYRSVFNVIWSKVISKVNGFTEEKMENAVNQLMSFN